MFGIFVGLPGSWIAAPNVVDFRLLSDVFVFFRCQRVRENQPELRPPDLFMLGTIPELQQDLMGYWVNHGKPIDDGLCIGESCPMAEEFR